MSKVISLETAERIIDLAEENPTWDCYDVAKAARVTVEDAEEVMRAMRYGLPEEPVSNDLASVDATLATPIENGSTGLKRPFAGIEPFCVESARSRQEGGSHYKQMGVEPWDVIDTWSLEQRIGFFRGNALKYLMRMGAKDAQAIEVRKARHYVDKLIETLEDSTND